MLDAAKVKELGLDKAKKKLVVTARGETREFVIGQPPQSSGESYLRVHMNSLREIGWRDVMSDPVVSK